MLSLNFPPVCRLAAESRGCAPRAGSRGSGKHGFQFGYNVPLALRLSAPRPCCIQNQANRRGVLGLGDSLRQIGQSFGLPGARRHTEELLGEFFEPAEVRSAAGENKAGGDLAVHAAALEVFADERKELGGARLDNLGKRARKDGARRTIAYAGDFNRAVFREERRGSAAVITLDALGFGNGGAQSDR